MSRLKRQHPNRDFFILDIADVVPKDDTASMEHPIFSLATKPDMRELRYENGDVLLKVIPSGHGLATIHDKDILIWAISKIVDAKNRGHPYSKTVRGSGYEVLAATNRPTNNLGYARLEAALTRLRGTTFVSNIKTGGKVETRVFGLVDEASFHYDVEATMRRDSVEVVLSDWLFRAVENLEVVTISPEYFELRRPLERRLYEIGRKHCGYNKKWTISLDKLQKKTGSNAALKRFRHNVREIITEDITPFYSLELNESDQVVYRPRETVREIGNDVILPSWAEDQAREIAREKGRDYYALEQEWLGFARSGKGPDNPGAAFVGFCKKKSSLR
jgi:plasmid replication initiation protein